MVKETGVLAIIPARGGSKSIPKKNIQLFAGHPLVAYSIAAGVQAAQAERVVVSTDDEEIAAVSREYGAETPFIRPASLAQDDTPDLPVFEHVLSWLKEQEGYHPALVVQLRPTSPIRPPGCVDEAIRLLRKTPQADSVRGVVPSGQNPYKMWRLTPDGALTPLLDGEFQEPFNLPRQELPPTYWQTGHIDVIRARTILELGSMSGKNIYPLFIDPGYTVDIDTMDDWRRAEWLVNHSDLPFIRPGFTARPFPSNVSLLVMDFDGVLTDDRVWVDETGTEMIAAHRGDGLGLELLRSARVATLVLSKEKNPVVAARCEKLGIHYIQGVDDKAKALQDHLSEHTIPADEVIFIGNDINDLPCFPIARFAVAVADAHPHLKREADLILHTKGGFGAVRELCELILSSVQEKDADA